MEINRERLEVLTDCAHEVERRVLEREIPGIERALAPQGGVLEAQQPALARERHVELVVVQVPVDVGEHEVGQSGPVGVRVDDFRLRRVVSVVEVLRKIKPSLLVFLRIRAIGRTLHDVTWCKQHSRVQFRL